MRTLRISLLTLLFALACSMIATAQSASIIGDWDVTINSPVGESKSKATFKQDGDKLTGLLKGERGELPTQVTLNGKEIKIVYTIKYDGNDMVITMKGNVDGDSMKGPVDFGGLAEGDWSGKRSAMGGAASAPASAASGKTDVTGEWAFAVETAAGSGSPSFTFKQSGEMLTGQYKGQLGEAPVTGTVKGDEINFSFDISQGKVVYKGKIENGMIKGTLSLGDLGSGTFTAKRK
jgi:hypothetical protein